MITGLLVPLLLAAAARSPHPSAKAGPVLVPVTAQRVRELAAAPGAPATLVNVWATWCPPCKQEMPELLSVARLHRAQGLRFLLVSADFEDETPAVTRFLRSVGFQDTSYIKSQPDQEFIDTLTPRWSGTLPATMIFDARGELADFWEGIADSARIEAAVRRVISKVPTR